MQKFFLTKSKNKLPVNEKKYLFKILNPTSKGSKYYEPQPKQELTERQIGRILLQCHQFCSIMKSLNINLKGKNLLDIGTGNGLVPKILLNISDIKKATGVDPYLDGEHLSSWQKHSHDNAMIKLKKILKNAGSELKYQFYKKKLKFENFSLIPQKIILKKKTQGKYNFYQLGAHELKCLKKKYDLIYCKAIEHISNWDDMMNNIASISKKKTIIYIKHRSFFSYLGPHRYCSTFIPWGHLLMKDNEIKQYVEKYHKKRKKKFLEFYFKGLTYPRTTVNELLSIAQKRGFFMRAIQIEKPKYSNKTIEYINDVNNFWNIVWKNYPRASAEEILSGIYHIVLEKK